MTIPVYRSCEPLYTVIFRNPDARALLTKWSTSSRSVQVRVEDNRMQVYDHNTLNLFVLTWDHSWDNLVIWDPWTKRHINF